MVLSWFSSLDSESSVTHSTSNFSLLESSILVATALSDVVPDVVGIVVLEDVVVVVVVSIVVVVVVIIVVVLVVVVGVSVVLDVVVVVIIVPALEA